MFRRILVPVDLTVDCARALPVAAATAHRARAEVVALAVTADDADPERDRYEARCFLRAHGGRQVDVSLDPGRDVADAIATHARQASTLVCMSSHGRARWAS